MAVEIDIEKYGRLTIGARIKAAQLLKRQNSRRFEDTAECWFNNAGDRISLSQSEVDILSSIVLDSKSAYYG